MPHMTKYLGKYPKNIGRLQNLNDVLFTTTSPKTYNNTGAHIKLMFKEKIDKLFVTLKALKNKHWCIVLS